MHFERHRHGFSEKPGRRDTTLFDRMERDPVGQRVTLHNMASSRRLFTYNQDSTGFNVMAVVPGGKLWVIHHLRVYCASGSGNSGSVYLTSESTGESPSVLKWSGLSWGHWVETYKRHVLIPACALHLYVSSGGYTRVVCSGHEYKYGA